MSRRFEHYTEEQLNAREQRFRAAIDGNIRGLELLAEERAIRRSGGTIENEPAAPQHGAAGPQ